MNVDSPAFDVSIDFPDGIKKLLSAHDVSTVLQKKGKQIKFLDRKKNLSVFDIYRMFCKVYF